MIEDILNKDRAEALFNSKAVFINGRDVIGREDAIAVLGKAPFEYAIKHAENAINGYGIGSYTFMYMTKQAFFMGITYRNIEIIAQAAKSL